MKYIIILAVSIIVAIIIIVKGWKAWKEEGIFWFLLFSIFLGAPIGAGIAGEVLALILK